MNKFYKLIAVAGIVWAILISPVLYFRAAKDGHDRVLANLTIASQDLFTKTHLRNGWFIVPENYGDAFIYRTQRLLEAEDRHATRLALATWVSSAFILVLSLYALKASKKTDSPTVES